jgi:hypothetical protein
MEQAEERAETAISSCICMRHDGSPGFEKSSGWCMIGGRLHNERSSCRISTCSDETFLPHSRAHVLPCSFATYFT